MAIYVIAYCLALLGTFTKANKTKTNKKIYLFIVFGVLLFISMFRSPTVGRDMNAFYSGYYPQFANTDWSNITNVTASSHWEWGYCALNKLLCYISTDVQFFVIVTSIISIVPVAIFIYKNSEDVVFSSVFFIGYHVFCFFLNAVRQSLAFAIILLGMEKLKKGQYIRFALFVLVASSIHTSAIICLVMILLDKIKLKRSYFYLMIVAAIAFLGGYNLLVEFVLKSGMFSDIYGFYDIGSGYAAGYITVHTLGMFVIAVTVLVMVFINYRRNNSNGSGINNSLGMITVRKHKFSKGKLIFYNKTMNNSLNEGTMIYGVYITVLFRLAAFLINVTSRLMYYFVPFVMVAFPKMVGKSVKERRLCYGIMYAMLTGFYLYILIFRGDMWGVVPYKFFWG